MVSPITAKELQTGNWFELFVEAAGEAKLIVDREQRIVFVNRSAESLFGYSRTELIGQPIEWLLPHRIRTRHSSDVAHFFAAPTVRPMGAGRELYGLRKDGTDVPIEIGLNPIEMDGVVFTLASIIDITERKRATERFRLVVEAAPNAMIMIDRDGLIALANRNAEDRFGYSRAELLGRPIEMLVPQRFRGRHPGLVADFFAAPALRSMGEGRELYALRKDGTEVPVEIGLNPIEMAGALFTLASIIDISTRKRADEVHQQMTALVESAEDAILTKGLDGIVRTWNPGAESLLGYRADEIIGKPVTLLLPEDRQDEEAMILDRIRRGHRVAHFETVRRCKDGSRIDVSLMISPIRDRAGRVIGASKIMRDMTARRRAEDELHRSNAELKRTNQELDDFVYTASHDLRSPLTAVGTIAQWILEDDTSLSTESRERLVLILGRIERMKRLLSDIRDYAQAGELQPAKTLSAFTLVEEVAATVHVPGAFSVCCDASLASVEITRAPLEQVLHNLIGNAIKHHDRRGGIVTVSVESAGPLLRFSVIDDGPGIPEEYRERVFEMFQTLKPRDEVEGSGMGLALVRKIVGRMGGDCGIAAAPGRGTHVWFDWPRPGQSQRGRQ